MEKKGLTLIFPAKIASQNTVVSLLHFHLANKPHKGSLRPTGGQADYSK